MPTYIDGPKKILGTSFPLWLLFEQTRKTTLLLHILAVLIMMEGGLGPKNSQTWVWYGSS